MNRRSLTFITVTCSIVATIGVAANANAATLQPQMIQAWNDYVAATEARIDSELQSSSGFLVSDFSKNGGPARDEVLKGAIPVERLTSLDRAGQAIHVPDGLIQHWRSAVFLRGVALDSLLDRLQQPSEDGPRQQDVLALRVLSRQPDHLNLAIRMTRSKIVTVTYDTEHKVDYRRLGSTRAASRSVSTKIVEIDGAGTPGERALQAGEDRGFLWRMNSYWRYERVKDGIIVELESVTLSRAIPLGLGVIVKPIIDRIARESLNRTLDNLRHTYTCSGTRTAEAP
jgi:hypothetical protein